MKNSGNYFAVGAVLEGKLIVKDNVTINGNIVGSVEGEQEVLFEKDAQLEGPVRAQVVLLKGKIKGEIFSNHRVEILPGGQVEGNITTPKGGFIVRPGGILNSHIAVYDSGTHQDLLQKK
ncbi:MAG: polymer-forming cytoskeletal protein [SAR324 cluster bacterium]|nr:polymer-forming cytoskeletal protein [SAR324 cluster bacterium]